MSKREDFDSVLRAAIADITQEGGDEDRLLYWLRALRKSAEESLLPQATVKANLARAFRAIMNKMMNSGILRRHPGVDRFTLEDLRPEIRDEVERRVISSAELIKLNREEEIPKMLRRFAGWATSIPRTGSKTTNRKETSEDIRKSLSGLSFRERRLLIDQGVKLTSAINDIVATDGGAIAAKWVSNWKQTNYDFRDDHKARMLESARLPFLIRNSWAHKRGLVQVDGSKYTDDLTQPGEEPFCQCYYEYIYKLSDLPDRMLTKKGREVINASLAA